MAILLREDDFFSHVIAMLRGANDTDSRDENTRN